MKRHKKILILIIVMLVFNMLWTLPLKATDNLSTVKVIFSKILVDENIVLWKLPDSLGTDSKSLLSELKEYTDEEITKKFGEGIQEKRPLEKKELTFENLQKGTYYLKQIDSGKIGDRLVPIVFKVEDNQNITIYGKTINDENEKSNFKFLKIDKESQIALKGAVFDVLIKEGATFTPFVKDGKNIILTSDENGEFQIEDLPLGTYYLRELEAPIGYKKLETTINFEVTRNSEKNYLKIENEKKIKIEVPYTGDVGLIYAVILGMSLFLLGLVITKEKK